tara:strand:- start:76 stop:324 length:249 start_codon:yes stop_codon:yes gene_type:complete
MANIGGLIMTKKEVKKTDANDLNSAWWETIKTGGSITSGKAGITNMAYGKGAQKPKKPKKMKPKKEEEEYPLIPDEKDFWRD